MIGPDRAPGPLVDASPHQTRPVLVRADDDDFPHVCTLFRALHA